MKPFNEKNKIKIESDEDFNLVVEDMFQEFLESLIKNDWAKTRLKDDDLLVDGFEFRYTQRAMKLIERYKHRMCKIGDRHFPDGDIRCESHLYVEV